MRRGTRVGQAYIALTADGSGINDDISDSMDDADFEGLGDRHGREYEDNLRKHLDNIENNFYEMSRRFGQAIDSDNTMGDGIAAQVARAFDMGNLDEVIRDVGRRAGVEFGGEFDRQVNASVLDSVQNAMTRAARENNPELSGMFSSVGEEDNRFSIPGNMLDGIRDSAVRDVQRAMDEQARIIVQSHTEALRENADHDRTALAERQRVWTEGFRQAEEREARSSAIYEQLLEGERSALERSLADRAQMEEDDARRRNRERIQYEQEFSRMLEEEEGRRASEQAERDRDWARMEQERDTNRFQRFDQMARRLARNIDLDPRIDEDKIMASFRRLRADLESRSDLELQLNAELPIRERERIQAELEGIRARIRVSLDEDRLNRELLRASGIIDRAVSGNQGGTNKKGFDIGRLFGAGSRNNALNLLGKSISNVQSLATGLTSGLTKLTGIGGESASMFTKVAMGAVATGAALSIVAVVGALLVSVMSALLALLVAVTSTIVSGLTGALLVTGGLLTAVAAAGGLVAVAFTSMTDAQKDFLGSSFQPIKAELTGLGQLMITQMIPYFETWSTNLQNALVLLAPLANVMGGAFGRAGATLTAAFSGPGFQNLINSLTIYLPGIVTNLSSALGGFLNGMAGLFAALMPYVSQFSEYLARVADRFSNWANSAAGQNAIVDFTDRALTALHSLWEFTQSFFGWLGDLLFNSDAQAAGNTIFDSLTRSFEGFRQSIADGSLENWFARAIEFGGDLKDIISSLADTVQALDNDGALEAMGNAISDVADFINLLNDALGPIIDILGTILPYTLTIALAPLILLTEGVEKFIDVVVWAIDPLEQFLDKIGVLNAGMSDSAMYAYNAVEALYGLGSAMAGLGAAGAGNVGGLGGGLAGLGAANAGGYNPTSLSDLLGLGNSALNNTSESNGGYKPPPAPYVSPYADWAEQMLRDGQNVAADMRKAMRQVNVDIAKAIREAASAPDVATARAALNDAMGNALATGESVVTAAQAALDAATRTLGSTGSAKETAKALKQWYKMQAVLEKALKNQARLERLSDRLGAQRRVDPARVANLVNGFRQSDATLAEYAAARARIAVKIQAANEKLADAIAMRDDYKNTVIDSVKTFGSLITAQAKTINGIEQALTAGDIIGNLQTRLDQIRKFQSNLRKLLAMGLSNDAYKQLVDAGVEQGGAYAEALVNGGQGAVLQVNTLTGQIGTAASSLGAAASSRLYQAGVDAARGLVEGLESMSQQLDNAATRLGNSIARAIKRALGIKSPSTVMRDMMNYGVGDGIVKGLDEQHGKVDAAAARLAGRIQVSPEVARYAQAQADAEGVSQNPAAPGTTEFHAHITSPTADPKAAAREWANEMTGRLG